MKLFHKNNGLKRTIVNLNKPSFNWDSDKIVVKTSTEENLLQLSRSNQDAYDIYIELLNHDYVLYMHQDQRSYFIKREEVWTIWQRKDLIQQGQTFYTLADPLKNNKLAKKRLVVIFSSMPPAKDYFSDNVARRMFVQNYPSMPKHLLKNTFILRIMDLNRSSGSYYLNAGRCHTLENDVQAIINKVCEEHHIMPSDVVLYGGSKGGTGALYHSILGNYHAVVVDPIFSIEKYNKSKDMHYLKNTLPEKLLPKFQDALKKYPSDRKKVILGTSQVPENYSEYSQIDDASIKVVNLQDDAMDDHVKISMNCTPEQITLINDFLMGIHI